MHSDLEGQRRGEMKKEGKHFEIRSEGNVLTITTDKSKFGTLETLLRLIFNEYAKKKPEELDCFMMRLNTLYELTRNRGKPKHESEPLNDFNFWKGLMEQSPMNNG
ncbi:hypothetical protein D3C76_1461380 [compost metagenome]